MKVFVGLLVTLFFSTVPAAAKHPRQGEDLHTASICRRVIEYKTYKIHNGTIVGQNWVPARGYHWQFHVVTYMVEASWDPRKRAYVYVGRYDGRRHWIAQ
jgi:hypothetical protein